MRCFDRMGITLCYYFSRAALELTIFLLGYESIHNHDIKSYN